MKNLWVLSLVALVGCGPSPEQASQQAAESLLEAETSGVSIQGYWLSGARVDFYLVKSWEHKFGEAGPSVEYEVPVPMTDEQKALDAEILEMYDRLTVVSGLRTPNALAEERRLKAAIAEKEQEAERPKTGRLVACETYHHRYLIEGATQGGLPFSKLYTITLALAPHPSGGDRWQVIDITEG